jgi:hypothetical protein
MGGLRKTRKCSPNMGVGTPTIPNKNPDNSEKYFDLKQVFYGNNFKIKNGWPLLQSISGYAKMNLPKCTMHKH